ncbi:MAG: DUF1631 family protein [Aquisalimonadaceae bacterium]
MATERRAYKRHSISWDADVGGEGFGPLAFVVTDFCEGGLFLEPATKTADTGLRRHLRQSDWIEVGLTDPVSGSRRQVHSRVARVTDNGFGLAFHTPQPTVVSALMTVAAGARSAANHELYAKRQSQPLTQDQAHRNGSLLARCRGLIAEFLSSRLESFSRQIDTVLLRSAENAQGNTAQSDLLSALDALNSNQRGFNNILSDDILDHWGKLGRFSIGPDNHEAGNPDQLSLVNDQDFDDWLARSDIITRAETRSIGRLRLLHRRLSELAGGPIDEFRNPVSPAVLCHELSRQLDRLEFPHDVRLLIYPTYGSSVLGQLNTLYDSLNALLREAGVLPDLENERQPIQNRRPGADNDRRSADKKTKPDQADTPTASGSNEQARQETFTGGGGPQAASSVSRSVRNLFRAQRRHAGGEDVSADTRPAVPRDTLIQASEALRQAADEPDQPLAARLKKALTQAFPQNPPQLNSAQTETVDLLDQWFTELRPDIDEQPFFSHWSKRLKPLALQEEFRSGAILDNRDHALHRLLNALDVAAEIMAVSSESERLKLHEQLTPALEQAVDHFDGRPETLATAAEQLEEALQRPQRALEAGMERVRQTCEGAQRLELARRTVEQALNKRLGGKAVPQPVLRLIEQGWRNHLVLVELRQGADSPDWTRGLRALEILAAGMGSPDIRRRLPREPAKVLHYVQQQLLASNRPHVEVSALITEIDQWLKRPSDSTDLPPSQVFDGAASRSGQPDLPQEWLGQAKLLRIGDWIQLRDDAGHRQQLRLAWISRDQDRFVFVGRNGKKAAELTLEALATQLGSQRADAETDFNAPVTERRWQDMLVKLNRQLVHSATHDPLTGLLNRPAFQRRIRALLERTSGEQEHVLVHVALDDFKVVNNSLGHDGGDQVLRQVGQLMVEGVARRGLVGRIGGDEFGILMTRCSAQEAEALTEKHLNALRQHRFTVGGESVKIAASIGVVPFSRESHSIEDLLKDSDGASFTAKKQGGNRIHFYSPGDAEMEKLRESMSQATRIDQALDAGLLTLRCQRIEPLQGLSTRPLYEVLISMTGDQHENMRPDLFIPAAERFGRMPALDRWVIREVFRWASSNPGRLQEIEHLSVNLSGQTIGDVGFVEFLKGQFLETGVPPQKICLEVTETAAVANLALAADLIRELKQMGCRFALDDFGSGLSSYSYLKNLPADYLKIDGEFIRELAREGADDAMVRSIHELSHHLGKLTVAEYVETDSVRALLAGIGLDYGQGYAIERPIPLDELGMKSQVTL